MKSFLLFLKLGLAILLGSRLVFAQLPSQPMTTNDVVSRINLAQSELLVAVTTMQQHEVAQALHDASYKRGTAVYILVPKADTESPRSEINSLVPAGAKVRTSEVDENLIIIDRTELLKGEGLITNATATVSIQDEGEVARVTNIFIELFKNAAPYTPVYIERPNP